MAVTHLGADNFGAGHFGASILVPGHLGANPLYHQGHFGARRFGVVCYQGHFGAKDTLVPGHFDAGYT